MTRILVRWTARRIHPCVAHFEALTGVDQLIITGHTETELANILPSLLEQHTPSANTPVMIAPDDLIVSQYAMDAVFEHHEATGVFACGWSNVDFTHPIANVTLNPPAKPEPAGPGDYDFLPISSIASRSTPFDVGFNGMTLLTMPAWAWQAPDLRLNPCGETGPGYASDWALCRRIHEAGYTLVCVPQAFAAHMKTNYTKTDNHDAWKRVNVRDKRTEWRPHA